MTMGEKTAWQRPGAGGGDSLHVAPGVKIKGKRREGDVRLLRQGYDPASLD